MFVLTGVGIFSYVVAAGDVCARELNETLEGLHCCVAAAGVM